MNTNDIQELFDGGLGDDRMAELLHVLSVSPEKRTALRQHIALRSVIEEDKHANALNSDEDALVWGAIVGGGAAATASAASSTWGGWAARGAAALLIGAVGYLLGSGTVSNFFGGADQPAVAEHPIAAAPLSSAPVPQAVEHRAAAATTNATAAAATVEPTVVYRDRIVYQDRIVYRDRDLDNGGADGLATTSSTVPSASSVLRADESATAHPSNTSRSDGSPILAAAESSRQTVPVKDGPTSSLESRSPESSSEAKDASDRGPVRANGLELVYNERVGRLTPIPTGIENPDPDFSNRSVGAIFRFADGRFGIGGRLVYGTLASVSLEKVGTNIGDGTDWGPKLQAERQYWFEAVVNYRLPLSDRLALTAEGSFGSANNNRLFGADLGALWFLTDNIAAQLGVGIGGYSYDLREDRKRLIESSQNDGVTSGASDTYQGTILQGRYGLFYRF